MELSGRKCIMETQLRSGATDTSAVPAVIRTALVLLCCLKNLNHHASERSCYRKLLTEPDPDKEQMIFQNLALRIIRLEAAGTNTT